MIFQRFPLSGVIRMWVRHKCTLCKGTGKIKKEDCQCEVFPDYLKLFPNAEWQNTSRGVMEAIPSKCLVYAVSDEGCIIINDWSEVRITPIGVLPQSMTPKTVSELNALCSILKLRILYLE
jgi:hypothetical protein